MPRVSVPVVLVSVALLMDFVVRVLRFSVGMGVSGDDPEYE